MAWRLSKRERWCVVVLPTLAVVGAYVFAIMRPMDRRLKAARQQMAQISKSPVTPAAVAQQRNQLQQALAMLDAEKDRADGLKQHSAPGKTRPASDSAASLAPVAKMLERSGLMLLGAGRVPDSEARSLLPPQLRPGAESAGGQSASAAQIWRVEIEGPYSGVLAWLDEIGAMDRLVIPLNVAMESGRTQGGLRRWTIWLYV